MKGHVFLFGDSMFNMLLARLSGARGLVTSGGGRRRPGDAVRRAAARAVEPLEARQLFSTVVWDGGGANNLWATAANWAGDVAPVAGDTLQFAGTVRTSTSNNFAAGTAFAAIEVAANNFTLAGNQVALAGGVIVASGVTTATVSLPVNLTASQSVTVASGATLTVSGVVSGSAALTKAGAGTLVVSGSNTYSGGTTVDAGTMDLRNSNAAGTTGTVSVTATTNGVVGTTLRLTGGVTIPAGVSLVLNSALPSGRSSLVNNSGNNTWAGPVTLQGNFATQMTVSAGTLAVSGAIGGSSFTGNLTLRGTGTGSLTGGVTIPTGNVIVTDNSTWTVGGSPNSWANTTVNYGRLKLGAAGALPSGTTVALGQAGNAGTLDLNGFDQTVAGISVLSGATASSQSVTNSNASAGATLTVNTAANAAFGGSFVAGGGMLGLRKLGAAMLTLSGNDAGLNGTVAIDAGKVVLASANAGSAAAAWTLAAGTALEASSSVSLGSLAGAVGSRVSNTFNNPSPTTFQIGALNTSTTYAGDIRNNGKGVTKVDKVGTGVLSLSGSHNTYSGGTTYGGAGTPSPATGSIAQQLAFYRISIVKFTAAHDNALTASPNTIAACTRWVYAPNWEAAAAQAVSGAVTVNSSPSVTDTFSASNVSFASNSAAGDQGTPYIITDNFFAKNPTTSAIEHFPGVYLALEDRYNTNVTPDYDYNDDYWKLDIQQWDIRTGRICYPCVTGVVTDSGGGVNADGVSETGQNDVALVSPEGGSVTNQGGSPSSGNGVATGQAQLLALDTKDHWSDPQNVLLAQGPNAQSFSRVGVAPANAGRVLYAPSGASTGGLEVLTHDIGVDTYTLTRPDGTSYTFAGLSESWGCVKAGQMLSCTDAGGNTTTNSFDPTTGQLTETQTPMDGSSTGLRSRQTTYLPIGDTNAGFRSTVSERMSRDGGVTWATTRVTTYAYYAEGDAYGSKGDLKSVTVTDAASNVIDRQSFRYYTADTFAGSTQVGYKHGLKSSFGTASLARLGAAGFSVASSTDAQLAAYADHQFTYDAQRRVTTHTAQGEGCSTCTGGQGTYSYAYASGTAANPDPSGDPKGFNVWRKKLVETLPDGNTTTRYTNEFGQTVLSAFKETASGKAWLDYYRYDVEGRQVLHANPSAVTGYDEAKADLVNYVSGNAQYLADATGLIDVTSYYGSTTATVSIDAQTDPANGGGVDGRKHQTSLRHGEGGSDVLQSTTTYFAHAASGGASPTYVTASNTVYANDDGTGGRTTKYAYAFAAASNRIVAQTTIMPVVATSQNGSGVAAETTSVLDGFGRTTWSKDALGHVSYTAYDTGTGAAVKMIADVDYAKLSAGEQGSFNATGWDEPAGLHQVSTAQVDDLGRTVKSAAPDGLVTYTVYKDAVRETRVYAAWDAVAHGPLLPIQITREDLANKYTESLTMSVTPALDGSDLPTGAEAIGNVQSLSRSYVNDSGQAIGSRTYTSLPPGGYSASADLGAAGTNYLGTSSAYDNRGRLERTQAADGTITHYVYDALGRSLRTWVGTNDAVVGGSKWSEALNGSGTSNMLKVSESLYDEGDVGDGNLTRSMTFASDLVHYDSNYAFDWRNRSIGDRGPDGVATATTYNNLEEVTLSQIYADQDADFNLDVGELRGQTAEEFDSWGRPYSSSIYNVDPATGFAGHVLVSRLWYDARGMVIKTCDANGLFAKTKYDGLGRVLANYSSFDSDETGYAAASDLVGDTVVEQGKAIYNVAGQIVASTEYARIDGDTTTTGELTPTNSYLQTSITWYDKGHRQIANATFGRDDGSGSGALRYIFDGSGELIDDDSDGVPNEAEGDPRDPGSSDDYIVTRTGYDAAGRAYETIDNDGHKTREFFDLAGRKLKLIENFNDGVASESETDRDRVTETVYDSAGRASKLIAYNAQGSGNGIQQQITRYLYESTTDASLLTNTIYPDSNDTTSGGTDQVTSTYDRLGRKLTSTDQRGVSHVYAYDGAGRILSDSVASLGGSGLVDAGIRRIQYSYDDSSRVTLISSYDAANAGSVVNQVQTSYDGWGRVAASYQEHNGEINGTSPKVQYTYDDAADGNNAKYVRLSKITYPNGREVYFNLGTDAVNEHLVRTETIADASFGTSTYARYTYLGSNTVTKVERPNVATGLTLSYGEAGTYSGWDRFGRVVGQKWTDGSGANVLDQHTYTYDRNGNRITHENVLYNALSEDYTYDGVDRLVSVDRSGAGYQDWTLDSLGNWRASNDGGLNQSRTFDAANQIASLTDSVNVTPSYDDAGNMIADESAQRYVYDAWSRTVAVKNFNGDVTVSYALDGLNRRISEHPDTTYGVGQDVHFYYNEDWQVLEERQSGGPTIQNIWGIGYIDDLIVRDTTDSAGTTSLYGIHDANYNVTATTDSAGDVTERYAYNAYGKQVVLDEDFAPDTDGLPDSGLPYGFQGLRADANSGNWYARNRDQRPTLGVWTQRDPAEYIDGVNLYSFARLNPTVVTDPTGLFGLQGLPIHGAGSATHASITTKAYHDSGVRFKNEDGMLTAVNFGNEITDSMYLLSPPRHAQEPKWIPHLGKMMKRISEWDCSGSVFGPLQAFAATDQLLKYIGGTMHAIQDFYTHTDWVDGKEMVDVYEADSPNYKLLGQGHAAHGEQTINLNAIFKGGVLPEYIGTQVNYFHGGEVPGIRDAHNLYNADGVGAGRDRKMPGSHAKAARAAIKSTVEFIRWVDDNLTCSCHMAVFGGPGKKAK